MDKISNTTELVSELRAILAYSETPNPSRSEIADKLSAISQRVGYSGMSDFQEMLKWQLPSVQQSSKLILQFARLSRGAELRREVISLQKTLDTIQKVIGP